MANCKYCGKPAGLCVEEHESCRISAKGELTLDQIRAGITDPNIPAAPAKAPRPLTAAGVFWAVFFALCLYGVLSGIIVTIAK
jgi:hypothetical protein